ncbi:MAG: AMP-binding protein [Marinicellaceae bacterium]
MSFEYSKRVAIHLDNSQLWLEFDKELTKLGKVIVPVPHFFTHQQIAHMVKTAGIDTVICANEAQLLWSKLGFTPVTDNLNHCVLMTRNVIKYPNLPLNTHKITFTSGTTNEPKGVCLSLQHLQEVGKSLAQVTNKFQVKKHMCVLPLSVLLENMAASYASDLTNIEVVTPSLAELGLSGSSGLDIKKLIGRICHYKPDSLILMPQMLKALIGFLEFQTTDLSFLKFIAVGGAVCSKGLLAKTQQLKLPVFEGYGISECGSVISLNTHINQIGHVGNILPHQKVKINSSGEIMTKGHLYLGYLGEECHKKEWYATGDLGKFNEKNQLQIIGRKKNVIINSFGRNISPDWIEAELLAINEIHQVVIYGEAKPYLTAICVSNSHVDDIWNSVNQLNKCLPDYAQVKQIIISDCSFNIENQMLTASGKNKHENIFKYFNNQLKEIYANSRTHIT